MSKQFKKKNSSTLHDHEIALTEACEQLPTIIIVNGEEAYLRRNATEHILKALTKKYKGIEETTFHGATAQGEPGAKLADILPELAGSSLFASEKVIVLRNADRILFPIGQKSNNTPKGGKSKHRTPQDTFTEFVKDPGEGTWLIVECAKLNRQYSLGKALSACAQVPCPLPRGQGDVASWLNRAAKVFKKRLDHGVADILYTAHGGNLGTLHSELEKLAIYIGKADEISTEDAKAFLSGSVEFDVFGLTNAIQSRNLIEAMKFARKIIDQGLRAQNSSKKIDAAGSARSSLAMISTTLEGILAARALDKEVESYQELGSRLKIHPYRAELMAKAALNYSLPELRGILSDLAEEMRASNDTGSDIALALERFVLRCCRK